MSNNNNNESNPLEGVADGVICAFTTLTTLGLQVVCNVAVLGAKGAWQVVELTADVIGIFYRLATGTYEYTDNDNNYEYDNGLGFRGETAATKTKLLSLDAESINANTRKTECEYMPVEPLYFTEIPKMCKYKSNKSDIIDTFKVYVGECGKGRPMCIDFYNDGSLLVGGMSRWGKTSLIYSILTSAMERYSPNALRILLIDYKMIDLTYIDNYKHMISDCITDNKRLYEALTWIEAEMEKRKSLFRKIKAQNIRDYNKVANKNNLPKLAPILVVIDEIYILFNNLEEKKAKALKVRINTILSASMGFGIYFIVCTQELSRETLGKMKNNFGQTAGFHTKDEDATDLIIKDGDLHLIDNVGRGKLETSRGVTEFQGYFTELKDVESILKEFEK